MKNILKLSIIILGISMFLFSCQKAQQIHPAPYPEAGVYISGSAIYLDSLNLDGILEKGKILNSNDEVVSRDSLYQKFMFITATGDFAVSQQVGTETIVYGLSGSWTEEETGVWSADITEGGTNYTVTEDGFYYFVIDLNLSKAFLFKIDSWYLSGSAVVADDAKIDIISADNLDAEWSGDDIEIKTGDMKFRFYPADSYNIDGDTIDIVTYLGGAFPQPEFGGSDFSTYVDNDFFSFTISYNFLTQFTSTNTMPPYDPRVHTYGLIGSAFHQDNDPLNPATAWDVDFVMDFDETSDTLNGKYSFVYEEMYFIAGGEFKIRLDGIWDNGEMGYTGVDYITGDVNNITNAGGQYGNFKITADALYNVTFTFDVSTFKKTIDFSIVTK